MAQFVSTYVSESNLSDTGGLLPGPGFLARNPDAIATPARTVSADCVPMSNQLLVVTNHLLMVWLPGSR
jgi:hypothetical protein